MLMVTIKKSIPKHLAPKHTVWYAIPYTDQRSTARVRQYVSLKMTSLQ